MDVVFVLPNSLFEDNHLINRDSTVFIYEHPIYFTKYKYHKLKLILARATMKYYEEYLRTKYKCTVRYLEYDYDIMQIFKRYRNKRIDMYDPVDHDVINEFKRLSRANGLELFVHDTPLFICNVSDLKGYLDQGGKYHQTSFYIWQRERLNILLTNDKKPVGGKWTYDTKNRLPYSDKFKTDANFKVNTDEFVKEAQRYVDRHFATNPGSTDLYLPITHDGANNHLKRFLKDRLSCFGPYQDTVSNDIIFGCHSVISPLLNIGLLTPMDVVNKILKFYKKHRSPISSVEGIIRQIVGWREIIRMMYMFKHKEMISMNHFGHNRKIGNEWYVGETDIKPIDDLIKKVLKYGYAHHIERLMYLGNFMLLSEFKPADVFKWFMVLFIDSYQWVMEGNVYAMSQYSTGPLLMTRPYFSSSNYIDLMSSYTRKSNVYPKIKLKDKEYEWYEIWDALYYNFIKNNKNEFSKNYSTATAVAVWNKKNKTEQIRLIKLAKSYLEIY
jgi:deoxyribodipyrimidine photolyase-related protein